MAERQTRQTLHVQLEYAFDRLHSAKLQQVYEILVPDRARPVGGRPRLNGIGDEDSRDLRQGLLGQAEGGTHHRQSDGGPDRVRSGQRLQHSAGVGVRSGASLVRPGLEKIRDLAAEGQIEAVLVHSPDRLSRKYAYQVLLIEEFSRPGVETMFLKSPRAETPEDQLLLQFQGMIAECERAQILERSRRGKRHAARQGKVSVLSGAPYGYRYVRKSDHAAAYYEIAEAEAQLVRMVYKRYTIQGLSIGEITRQLNEQGIPTRSRAGRWERSTIWAMLRNPAYRGAACYGKTQLAKRERITRPLRLRGGVASRESAHHERQREDWIEIPVPAIISDETFALAA